MKNNFNKYFSTYFIIKLITYIIMQNILFIMILGKLSVDLDDDIILISNDGVIIRIEANSIRICSRTSKGVRVMKVSDESKVVTLSRAPHEEETADETTPEE